MAYLYRRMRQGETFTMIEKTSEQPSAEVLEPQAGPPGPVSPRSRKASPTAVALVVGLAALTAQASETDLVRDIQRYCTVCWRNATAGPQALG